MALVYVQGGIRLEANAAASFKRVDAKFGGGLTITSPYGGHRDEAEQKYLRNGFVRGLPGFNYAAPARQSNHEGRAPDWEGFAVDINNWRSYPKLHAAMVAEGWVRDPVELWHYNYTGKRTQIVGAAGNVINIDEDDMTPDQDARLTAAAQASASARDESRAGKETAGWANENAAKASAFAEQALAKATEASNRAADATTTAQWANENADKGTKATIALTAKVDQVIAALAGKTTLPAAGGSVSIDYDLLANKVADKLAARLVS